MKRTAFVVALLLAVAATFLYLLGCAAVLLFAVCVFIAAIVLAFLRHRIGVDLKSIAAMLVAVLVCISFYTVGVKRDRMGEKLSDKRGTIVCRVVEEPRRYGNITELEVVSVDGDGSDFDEGIKFALLFRGVLSGVEYSVGDELSTEVKFQKIHDKQAQYYLYRGVYLKAWGSEAEVVGHKDTLHQHIVALRQYIRGVISRHLNGDSEALMKGLLLGDKTDFSDELYYAFKCCGLSHLVAVSGLHINIICLGIWSVLSKIVGRRKAAALMFIPLIIIIAVTGFTPSAIRAGIMFGLVLFGVIFQKNPDTLNSLGVAMAVMLTVNPYYIGSISFQLSFAATAGIIFSAPFADRASAKSVKKIKIRLVRRVLKAVLNIIILAVAANVFTLPFTAVHFGFVSLISPLVSVFVTPAATYSLTLGLVAVVLDVIPVIGNALSGVVFWVVNILTEYMSVVAKVGADIPFSYVSVDYKPLYLWLGGVLCLTAVWILTNKVGGKRMLTVMSMALFVLVLVGSSLKNLNTVKFTMLDTKTPCAVLSKNGECAVFGNIDDGNREGLLSYLKINSIKSVKAVVVTELGEKVSETDNVIGGYNVGKVISVGDTAYREFEIVDGVKMITDNEAKSTMLSSADKTIALAGSLEQAKSQTADIAFVNLPGKGAKVVYSDGAVEDIDGEWTVKIKNGKDMIIGGN